MGKDNNKSNSDLIQRLKTLLAESEQRPSNQPAETDREYVEEAIQDLLKNETDTLQNPPPDDINQEILQETAEDISISESEIQQSAPLEEKFQDIQEESAQAFSTSGSEIQENLPPDDVNQEILQETAEDISVNELEIQQNAPPKEGFQVEREEMVQDLKPSPEEITKKSPEEATRDFESSGAEIRQDEPPEEVKQEPEGRDEVSDPFKNKLREGVNMPQVGNYVVNYKNIVVKTSDGSVISGKTNIDAFGRLTEYLKQGTDRFITVFSEDAGDASKQVTIVNKDHIIWANTWD